MERCREHSRLGLISVDSTAGVMGLTGWTLSASFDAIASA